MTHREFVAQRGDEYPSLLMMAGRNSNGHGPSRIDKILRVQPSIRILAGIVACAALPGCNAVLGLDERPLRDDAAITDTSSAEDAFVDREAVDTFRAEDTVVDSMIGAADSFAAVDSAYDTLSTDTPPVPDTTVPPADTRPSDTGTGGVLTASSAIVSSAGTLNLSAEGTLDWGHWGHTTVTSFNHRVVGGLIGKGTTIGPPYAYATYPKVFSWSDGTPTLTASSDEGIAVLGAGDGFTVDAAASTTKVRTLRVYSVWNRCAGTVVASLNDGSAPTSMASAPPATTDLQYVVFIYAFRAETAGAKLTVKMLKGAGGGGGLNALSLIAATLQ